MKRLEQNAMCDSNQSTEARPANTTKAPLAAIAILTLFGATWALLGFFALVLSGGSEAAQHSAHDPYGIPRLLLYACVGPVFSALSVYGLMRPIWTEKSQKPLPAAGPLALIVCVVFGLGFICVGFVSPSDIPTTSTPARVDLTGSVVDDETGKPIPAHVWTETSHRIAPADGKPFVLPAQEIGRPCTLTITAPGYVKQVQPIELRSSGMSPVTIRLKREKTVVR